MAISRKILIANTIVFLINWQFIKFEIEDQENLLGKLLVILSAILLYLFSMIPALAPNSKVFAVLGGFANVFLGGFFVLMVIEGYIIWMESGWCWNSIIWFVTFETRMIYSLVYEIYTIVQVIKILFKTQNQERDHHMKKMAIRELLIDDTREMID